jgi:hypothetical protein
MRTPRKVRKQLAPPAAPRQPFRTYSNFMNVIGGNIRRRNLMDVPSYRMANRSNQNQALQRAVRAAQRIRRFA